MIELGVHGRDGDIYETYHRLLEQIIENKRRAFEREMQACLSDMARNEKQAQESLNRNLKRLRAALPQLEAEKELARSLITIGLDEVQG